MQRLPVVAGQFYNSNEKILRQDIENFLPKGKTSSRKAIGIVVPHAGLTYSGKVAAKVYASIKMPQTMVMIGPNHAGYGQSASIMAQGSWLTPLDETFVDADLAGKILKHTKNLLNIDETAQAREHSLEVQLPFLQYLKKDIKIVPIALTDYSPKVCQKLGEGIAAAFQESNSEVVILASSDMTHYESKIQAEKKDQMAIAQILKLNPETLLETVSINNITMCGSGPVAAMLYAAKKMGAKTAELIDYDTSGNVTGDYNEVVGYAGIVVF